MTDEQTLIDLQVAWMDAWQRQDREAIEAILAPEFTLTSARTDQIVDRAGCTPPAKDFTS